MNNETLIETTFNNPFNQETYEEFLTELFNEPKYEEEDISYEIDKGFEEYIEEVYNYGDYTDVNEEILKLYVVKLKKTTSLERARTMQRNFIAKLLSNEWEDNALVAFYDDNKDWRFSFIKIDYDVDENGNTIKKLSPAKRHSYLVGPTQSNHTCQKQFLNLIKYDDITINQIIEKFEVENVTDEFFEQYKELFHMLTESIEKTKEKDPIIQEEFNNKKIKSSDFAKKILGQIVFLYFIQKKGWLGVPAEGKWGEGPKDFLRQLYNKKFIDYDNFFNDVLEHLFYEGLSTSAVDYHYSKFNCKIPFINGGIFENINNYNWQQTDINLDNKIFEQILDTFDTFNFTVKEDEPLEKEVAIDPEMLGKVFEKLLEVNERKDKGAFYTPRHIVHEICQETLISYLETNTEDIPKEDIEKFIKEGYTAIDSIIRVQEQKLPEQEANQIIPIPNTIIGQMKIIGELLNNVKVVDPAVGSGAFPVGMLTEIVQAKHVIQLLEGYGEVNIYNLKRETIENSLYAVDISYSATDIAKLRFWLSLIVDEESIEDIRPLPNLDNKIMCGNSVIDTFEGIKLFDEELLETSTEKQTKLFDKKSEIELKKLVQYKTSYFNENTHSEKIKLKKQIQDTKWNFIEETIKEGTNYKNKKELLEKINQYKHAESKPFFIWELEFSEIFTGKNPGFDIVIGNPPYVRQEKIKELKPILKQTYETYTGTADLYVYFFEKGIKLLKEKGCLSYICSNKYTNVKYGKQLRKYILKNTVVGYNDFTGEKLFKEASVDTSVILIKKEPSTNNRIIINKEFLFRQSLLDENYWVFEKEEYVQLKEKISKQGILIKNIEGITINYGIKTGYDAAFIIDEKTRNELIAKDSKSEAIIKPLLRGKNVKKWKINSFNQFIIFTRRGININKYIHIKEYLLPFKERLTPRKENDSKEVKRRKPGKYEWYEIQDTVEYYKNFEKEKIIYPETGVESSFTIDNDSFYLLKTLFFITVDESINLKYLLAILNSNVSYWYFKRISSRLGKKTLSFKKIDIELLPVVLPKNSVEYNLFDDLIDNIYEEMSKDEINRKKIQVLEEKINSKVYKLYNLTNEEITIIKKDLP